LIEKVGKLMTRVEGLSKTPKSLHKNLNKLQDIKIINIHPSIVPANNLSGGDEIKYDF